MVDQVVEQRLDDSLALADELWSLCEAVHPEVERLVARVDGPIPPGLSIDAIDCRVDFGEAALLAGTPAEAASLCVAPMSGVGGWSCAGSPEALASSEGATILAGSGVGAVSTPVAVDPGGRYRVRATLEAVELPGGPRAVGFNVAGRADLSSDFCRDVAGEPVYAGSKNLSEGESIEIDATLAIEADRSTVHVGVVGWDGSDAPGRLVLRNLRVWAEPVEAASLCVAPMSGVGGWSCAGSPEALASSEGATILAGSGVGAVSTPVAVDPGGRYRVRATLEAVELPGGPRAVGFNVAGRADLSSDFCRDVAGEPVYAGSKNLSEGELIEIDATLAIEADRSTVHVGVVGWDGSDAPGRLVLRNLRVWAEPVEAASLCVAPMSGVGGWSCAGSPEALASSEGATILAGSGVGAVSTPVAVDPGGRYRVRATLEAVELPGGPRAVGFNVAGRADLSSDFCRDVAGEPVYAGSKNLSEGESIEIDATLAIEADRSTVHVGVVGWDGSDAPGRLVLRNLRIWAEPAQLVGEHALPVPHDRMSSVQLRFRSAEAVGPWSAARTNAAAAPWTPALLGGDFCALRFDDPETLRLVDGQCLGARVAYGGAFEVSSAGFGEAALSPDGESLDLSGRAGGALHGALPFRVSGPRDPGGSGDDLVDALTVAWVASEGPGGALFEVFDGSLGRYRVGVDQIFGQTSTPPGWKARGPHIRIATFRADGGQRYSAWIDGVEATRDKRFSSGSQAGTGGDSLRIAGGAGKSHLQFLAVIRGALDEASRRKLEGWMAHALGVFSEGDRTALLPLGHPYKAAPPFLDAAPIALDEHPVVSLRAGVHMAPLDLRAFVSGEADFSAGGLPEGLRISGCMLVGAPVAPSLVADYAIEASNSFGSTRFAIRIAVEPAPARGEAVDEDDIFAQAVEVGRGRTIVIPEAIARAADSSLRALSEQVGDLEAAVVGVTDFRDGAPADVDYESRVPVDYIDASGTLRTTLAASRRGHPMFGDGDWFDAATVAAAHPLDHLGEEGGFAPIGLRLATGFEKSANSVGHNGAPYDGRILWLAEFEGPRGESIWAWEELGNTRGRNPRLPIRHAAKDAVRLRRFMTLQAASHHSLRDGSVASTPDPRRWIAPSRLIRGAYPFADGASDWDIVSATIASTPVQPGDHVVHLAATEMPTFSLSSAALARLEAIRGAGGRVLLIGEPGRTIISDCEISGCLGLAFGWVTFTRTTIAEGEADPVLRGGGCDVGFHGCVLDGFDGSFQLLDVKGGSWTFADCYVGGVNGFNPPETRTNDAEGARGCFVRCLIDVANDGYAMYGPGSIRLESCYLFGAGGAWRNGMFLHPDLFGQNHDAKTRGFEQWIALYDNMLDSGPNAFIPDTFRAEPNLVMNQGGAKRCYDVVGNILVQPVLNGGWQRLDRARRTGDSNQAGYWSDVHFAQNVFLFRPDLVNPGWTYPQADVETFGGPDEGSIDSYVASDNLLSRLPDPSCGAQMGYSRTITVFPEERADPARGALADVAVDLASFPAVADDWDAGYSLDWSKTTYAGTSREGYLAPEDCIVSERLNRWGGSPIRGLPHDANYVATNFTGLPEDIRVHLGHVDAQGAPIACGYQADWFGDWRPAAFDLGAALHDPWRADADEKAMALNMTLSGEGVGAIFEEIDARQPLKTTRLEIVEERGARYPMLTLTDASGAVTHRWLSARPLSGDDRLSAAFSTRFRPHAIEGFQLDERLSQIVWDHYRREGRTDELSVRIVAADAPPSESVPTVGARELLVWCDLAASNELRSLEDGRWTTPPVNLREVAGSLVLDEWRRISKRPENGGAEQALSSLQTGRIGPVDFRLTLRETLDGFLGTFIPPEAPSAVNALGDRVFFARTGAYSRGGCGLRWAEPLGAPAPGWIGWELSTEKDLSSQGGEVPVAMRINGLASARRASTVWGAIDRSEARSIRRDARTSLVFDYDFALLDPAHLGVAMEAYREIDVDGERALEWIASPLQVDPSRFTVDPLEKVVRFASIVDLCSPKAMNTGDMRPGPLSTVRRLKEPDGDKIHVTDAEASTVVVTLSVQVRGDALGVLYGQDVALARGTVRVGSAAGYTGRLGLFEARRLGAAARVNDWRGPHEIATTAAGHRFSRKPIDIATGARDHPLMGPAEIWLVGGSA